MTTFSLVIVKYGITQDKLLFMSFSSMNGKGALIDSWYNLKQREKSGRTACVWHLHLDNRASAKEFD